jgi:two-component system chemotaxis sensor kinase CheA
MDDDLLEQFLIEGRELVAQASDDLIALERAPSDFARLDSLFRAVHTLKGSVALFDFAPMGAVLHAAEDLLGALRQSRGEISLAMIDTLLLCVDASERWIEDIARTGELPSGAEREGSNLIEALSGISAPPAVSGEESGKGITSDIPEAAIGSIVGIEGSARTVRVDAGRIDALVDLVGELIVAKNGLAHTAAQAAEANSPLANAFVANAARFEHLTSDMQRAAMALRMTPLSRIFARFPRWMRVTTSKLGKVIEFDVRDDGVEADKAVVDGLFEPLLHILRNAVDHGIEAPQFRQSAGKPASGRIALEARTEGDQIIVSISDDGAGLDPVRLRHVAKAKGLLGDKAVDALDDATALDLIFMPGFSSSDKITEISGRGVGMDAVRTAIVALGGRVTVNSTVGAGTNIELILPQAVLATAVITAQIGDDRFGVPIESIAETCRIPRDRIKPIRDGRAFVLRGRTLPLLRLSDLLHSSKRDANGGETKALIVTSGGQRVGVEIDGFGPRLDVLLRPMKGLLAGMPGVLGTALLGDGHVLVVLDLPALIDVA